jgi:hypothetical protein
MIGELKGAGESAVGRARGIVIVQIHILIVHGMPEPLDKDAFEGTIGR